MLTAEFQSKFIEQLSALPPRQRLEAFRAIQDPAERRQVVKALPARIYSEILSESMVDNLNRNVRKRMSEQKSDQAA
jgi:hypothetical protein